jgi:cytochrome o ubiquinol oxidase subunit 1
MLGFALIWHIWWMAILGLACARAVALVHAWRIDIDVEIPACELAKFDRQHRNQDAPA